MATIKAVLRTSNTNKKGKAPIRIRIRHQGKLKEISLKGANIYPKDWDDKNEKTINDKMLNLRIENEIIKFKQKINQFEALGKDYTLSDLFAGNEIKKQNSSNLAAIHFIEKKILLDDNLVYATKKTYKALIGFLKAFKPKLRINQINGSILNSAEQDLKKKGYSSHTIHNRLKCLKRTANLAYELHLIERPDWRGFKMKKGSANKIFLTKLELKKLLAFKPKSKLDTEILKAFLFSCFGGGLRFGDLVTLTYVNITQHHDGNTEQIRLSYTMNKTGNHVTTNLNLTAKTFIDNSKLSKKEMVFKILPYAKLGESYDDLLKAIESKNAYCNKRLKQICLDAGLERTCTFHVARHSFICLGIQLGIDYLALKELAGFSNVKVLSEHYAKVVDETKSKAMNLYDNL